VISASDYRGKAFESLASEVLNYSKRGTNMGEKFVPNGLQGYARDEARINEIKDKDIRAFALHAFQDELHRPAVPGSHFPRLANQASGFTPKELEEKVHQMAKKISDKDPNHIGGTMLPPKLEHAAEALADTERVKMANARQAGEAVWGQKFGATLSSTELEQVKRRAVDINQKHRISDIPK